MDKNFTIVLPTRDRLDLLSNLLQSIQATTQDSEKIEVLIAYDNDDQATREYSRTCSFPFVRFYEVARSLNFSRDYYNFLVKQSTGKWIIACNDDALFETKDWDVIAERLLTDKVGTGPNVIYGWIEDCLGKYRCEGFGSYCCFPLQGRDGVEALGYFFPDDIPTWGADIWARKLYDNVSKVITLPMTIKHVSHHNHLRPVDPIARRIANNQVPFSMTPTYTQVNALLRKIKVIPIQKQERQYAI